MKPASPLVRRLGWVLALAAAGGYFAYALRHAAALPDWRWGWRPLAVLLGGLALYEIALCAAALAWFALLRSVGERPTSRGVLSATLQSQIGKYLPGNVGHYLGRALLVRRQGVALAPIVATLAVETACAVLVAVALASRGPHPPGWRTVLIAAALVLALPVAIAALRRPSIRVRLGIETGQTLSLPRPWAWVACLIANAGNFVLFAVCGRLLAEGLLSAPRVPLSALLWIFAAAWVTGFVTPGAPAGLGVREALLTAGLLPLWGPGVAIALPLAYRLLTTLGDGLAFLAGVALRPMDPPREQR